MKIIIMEFLLTSFELTDRHKEPKKPIYISGDEWYPMYEELIITLKFTGSGDTREITDMDIIRQVYKNLSKLV